MPFEQLFNQRSDSRKEMRVLFKWFHRQGVNAIFNSIFCCKDIQALVRQQCLFGLHPIVCKDLVIEAFGFKDILSQSGDGSNSLLQERDRHRPPEGQRGPSRGGSAWWARC